MADYAAQAEIDAAGNLRMTRAGGAFLDGTPVEIMLGAVAGCFLKSAQIVQETKRLPRTAGRVSVEGTKAPDRPSRIAHIRIAWQIADMAPDEAARIARDAKRVCTVSNSIAAEYELVPG